MSFKITIEETTTEEKICGRDWAIIGQDEEGKDTWGHTPEIKKTIDTKQIIYTQIVSELCLVSVINAVNGV